MPNSEPNIQDVLEAISVFSSHVDEKFRAVRKDVARIEATMATKDFVDRRISDVEASFAPSPLLPRSLQ